MCNDNELRPVCVDMLNYCTDSFWLILENMPQSLDFDVHVPKRVSSLCFDN